MKKVLAVCYDFEGSANVGGALRAVKFSKYLPAFGWSVHVVCCHAGNSAREGRGVQVISRSARSLGSGERLWIWLPKVIWSAFRLHRKEKFDLIFVTIPPYGTALALPLLKLVLRRPAVLDLRDAWSLNPYLEALPEDSIGLWCEKRLSRWAEALIFRCSDYLIFNTPSMLAGYTAKNAKIDSKACVILNGFDEEDFEALGSVCGCPQTGKQGPEKEEKFVVTHAGILPHATRPLAPLLNAMAAATVDCPRLELKLVGPVPAGAAEAAAKLGLERSVRLAGPLPHAEALKEMQESSALLLYQGAAEGGVSAVAAKTFEYLRTGNPILAIMPPGDNLDLVRRYSSRFAAALPGDESAICEAFKKLYCEWADGKGPRAAPEAKEQLSAFSRKSLAGDLAAVFDRLVQDR